MPHTDVSIAIVGGGLGGLTAALSLLHAGFDVQVYERATVLREGGAGIQVSPNASSILHRLGLADELAKWACVRSPGTSDVGKTAARCCALRSPARSKPLLSAIPAERVHRGHRLTSGALRSPHEIRARTSANSAM